MPAVGRLGGGARVPRGAADSRRRGARSRVLVQIMVAAVTSGVAFTVNPITGADEIVINAARGLGEALVSGQIDPDEFRVGKTDGTVLSARAGRKQRHRGDHDDVGRASSPSSRRW